MRNSDEIRSNSDRKSTENNVKIPSGYLPVMHKESKEILVTGESWIKAPKTIYNLHQLIGASPIQSLVAHALIGFSIGEGDYPTFSVGLPYLAKKTGLTERAISSAIKFLTANRVLFVRSRNGLPNQYTWNETFILTPESVSVAPLNEVQSLHCNTFSPTTEPRSDIYIELSLEYLRISKREFFDRNSSKYKPYIFYVPGKRKSKKAASTTSAGSTRTVDRWDAWEEAVTKVWKEIGHEYGALTRLFFSLLAGHIEEVSFPYAVLRYRVGDPFTQNEARSRSHLSLYCDEDVKEFLDKKFAKENQ